MLRVRNLIRVKLILPVIVVVYLHYFYPRAEQQFACLKICSSSANWCWTKKKAHSGKIKKSNKNKNKHSKYTNTCAEHYYHLSGLATMCRLYPLTTCVDLCEKYYATFVLSIFTFYSGNFKTNPISVNINFLIKSLYILFQYQLYV